MLRDFHTPRLEGRHVADSVGQPRAFFDAVYDPIDGCVPEAAKALFADGKKGAP